MEDADNLYQLAQSISQYDSSAEEKDDLIASKIHSSEDLADIYFLISYGKYYELMPNTRIKINSIISKSIHENSIDWDLTYSLRSWLNPDNKLSILDKWASVENNCHPMWVPHIPLHDVVLSNTNVLSKSVEVYKYNRRESVLRGISNVFKSICSSKLDEASDILSKSTSSVASILLSRDDVSEKYMLCGLKAVSKLSRQKNFSIKIDFSMLEKLGPKSRMDAMKQLLGIAGFYRTKHIDLPFKSTPSIDDVKTFLFPCSIKYNTEVIDLVDRFSELTGQRR